MGSAFSVDGQHVTQEISQIAVLEQWGSSAVYAAWPPQAISKLKSLNSAGKPNEKCFFHHCRGLGRTVKALSARGLTPTDSWVAQRHPVPLSGALVLFSSR